MSAAIAGGAAPSILLVDADLEAAGLLLGGLRQLGYAAEAVASVRAAIEHLGKTGVDVVVARIHPDDAAGLELVSSLRDRQPEVLGIVVIGHGNVDAAIAAIRARAFDAISEPVTLAKLRIAIERAAAYQAGRRQLHQVLIDTTAPREVDAIVGDSPAIRDVMSLIDRIADSAATVLITGESGTGKELVARAVHERSSRRHLPFVALNCGAISPGLLESELFGHVRGAFTDARDSRPGLIATAAGGTLFLDEIGELPLEMQVKLLRVLQERTVRPVGSDVEVAFAARLIAATNRDLEHAVAVGAFREDLFYRINVVAIALPPLRARPGDVALLAEHCARRIAQAAGKPVATISAAAVRRLATYDWPGNVRELQNCMERAHALRRTSEITVDDLPAKIRRYRPGASNVVTGAFAELLTLADHERQYLQQVLAVTRNNKTDAARILGIGRRSLYRLLHERGEEDGGDGGGDGVPADDAPTPT